MFLLKSLIQKVFRYRMRMIRVRGLAELLLGRGLHTVLFHQSGHRVLAHIKAARQQLLVHPRTAIAVLVLFCMDRLHRFQQLLLPLGALAFGTSAQA